jgi:hypothetical protein
MIVYSVPVIVHATAYIKAEDEQDAQSKALVLQGATLVVQDSGQLISGLKYADPRLPEVSLSPAMIVGNPDLALIEEAE